MRWLGKKERDGLQVYMHPIELSQLVAAITAVGPRTFLEWGSGGSSRVLLETFPEIERFLSIEHERQWYEVVAEEVDDPRHELHLVEPDHPLPPDQRSRQEVIAWEARAEHERALMASYVDLPRTLGVSFDFVLVDGRARRFCLEVAWELVRSGGVIALHDAQREDYHDAVAALGAGRYLEPWEQGQICLLRRP